MHPYTPGKPISEVRRELGLTDIVKLASNENPLGPSPLAVEAVREAAGQMHVYPDGVAYDLRQAISDKFSLPAEQVILGNGSDELIHLLGLVFLGDPSDEVLCGDPSFVRYDAAAHLSASKLVKVPLDAHYKHDLAAMAKRVTERTKLVFIANPNNPTGTIVDRADLEAFLRDLPASVVTVLDEAYYEFAADVPSRANSLDFIKEGMPVVGLRTFSKAYGLAGIRVGYGFAPAFIVDAIERARAPFNVNSLAQVAAIAALNDEAHVRATVENNRRGLRRISEVLQAAGAQTFESFGNFVFADLHQPAEPVFQALLRKGVIVRPGGAFGAPNCLRVSVGTEEEVSAFVEAFNAVMREPAAR